jgi:hypothetical protein
LNRQRLGWFLFESVVASVCESGYGLDADEPDASGEESAGGSVAARMTAVSRAFGFSSDEASVPLLALPLSLLSPSAVESRVPKAVVVVVVFKGEGWDMPGRPAVPEGMEDAAEAAAWRLSKAVRRDSSIPLRLLGPSAVVGALGIPATAILGCDANESRADG